ncbi:MAG: DUF1080 domain-containing protein [Bryobacteraceae bacterium]
MKQFCLIVTLATLALTSAASNQENNSPFAGRWDLTVKTPDDTYPSWMEFTANGGSPEVRVVGRVGSVHPAKEVKVNGSHLSFATSDSFGKEIPVTWEMTATGRKLTGLERGPNGVERQITGVPAPALDHKMPTAWSDPQPLFDGKDLNGWEPDKPSENHWKAQDGELVNEAAGANIRTKRKFDDFKLHVEYNCPKDGNSGVYLRGRYEVQVEYEAADMNDKFHGMGSIYGFIPPALEVSPRPGEWETYDITLAGRNVSIVRDGIAIITNRQIPGITGGALDSHEGDPGPIYIQGDHTGGMKYRNITISLPR